MEHPSRASGVEIRTAGDDVLVHDANNDKIHVLNKTAGFVLERCDGTTSPDAIARELSAATGADLPQVTGDVEAIVHQFAAMGLLQPGL